MNSSDINSRLAIDSKGFESLKQAARTDPIGATKTVAKQFDAIFVNMMLKQMRDASPQNGLFDSSSSCRRPCPRAAWAWPTSCSSRCCARRPR
jgi:flagellar protein FlgJ